MVSPNPLVGAVIVRGERVIGEGHHPRLGDLHAERAALSDCRRRGEDPAGSTLYVTLEPCSHSGRQPPCTEAILEAGIARVVYASDDPSEKARGRGPGVLRDGGVEVLAAAGAEAAAARLLNQPFRKHARTGRPHVLVKMASSLDGFAATASGDSKWISGEASRALVHRWRAAADAVAVGIGTALSDDPLLTARGDPAARQPSRVVFDSEGRLPLGSRLVGSLEEAPLIVLTSPEAPTERLERLRQAGATVLLCGGQGPAARLRSALMELGEREITSLLVEGGPRLAGAFAAASEIDQLALFVAPLLMGGGRPAFAGEGADSLAEATRAIELKSEPVGEDILISARLREW